MVGSAAGVAEAIPTLILAFTVDMEQDARLAALEDEPNSDDEVFIADDSDDDGSSQDGDYELQSVSQPCQDMDTFAAPEGVELLEVVV